MRLAVSVVLSLVCCMLATSLTFADEKSDAEARRQITEALRELDAAYNRGDAKEAAAVYMEAAHLYPPNLPIAKGREAIEKFYQSALDFGFKGMESTLTEIEVFGDVAFAAGTMKLWRDDKAHFGAGKFTLLLKKVDGKWLVYRDCGNSSEK